MACRRIKYIVQCWRKKLLRLQLKTITIDTTLLMTHQNIVPETAAAVNINIMMNDCFEQIYMF